MDSKTVSPGIHMVSLPDSPQSPPLVRTKQETYEKQATWSSTSRPASSGQIPMTPNAVESREAPSYFESEEQELRGRLADLGAATPAVDRGAPIAPSFFYPPMNRWRVAVSCTTVAFNGLNDAAPGALLPYLESYYNIGYAVVSTIFVANAAGFITTAFATDVVLTKLGRSRALMVSEAIMTVGYVMLAFTPPFGIVALAYYLLGLGYALNIALINVFCAHLAHTEVILGAAHGSYGIGGLMAPLIATSMLSRGILWSRFFLILIGLRLVNLVFAGWANRNYESEPTSKFTASLERFASRQEAEDEKISRLKLLGQVMRNKVTLLGALFIFLYQGAEVAISGWIISYLIKDKHGDPSKVGYTTSGFFAGLTVGRLCLSYFAPRIGIKPYVYILIVALVVLQLMSWFIPSIIGDIVIVALLGVAFGPIYPCCATLFSRLLPPRLQVSSVGFIASAGSSGGAVFPFITGLLAQAVGPVALHPVCLVLYVVMAGIWTLLPSINRRRE